MTDETLMRFVLEMRQAGVTDPAALSALERTPRAHYAPAHLESLAFDDVNLPLPHGQQMSKPSLVGRMLAALDLKDGQNILEIGAGSGYQAAALSLRAKRVTTLDRWRTLVTDARARFGLARLMHVNAHLADGAEGWPEHAPYDRIVINAAVAEVPPALIAQLAPDGVLVTPVGGETQRLIRLRNGAREDLGPIKFAALEPGAES